MPTRDVDGRTIFYREVGPAGSPPLVLLHGLYGDSSTVMSLAGLADHFHVIAPDALGHGRSARPAAFTLADQGRMVNGLLAALGHDTAVLMGISMGSYVAAQAATLEPARTSRLVLVVTKGHGTTSSVVAYAQRHGFDLASATYEERLAFLAGALWSPETPQPRREQILAQEGSEVVEPTPDERAAIDRSVAGFDLRPGLSSITAPTLVISGRSDGLNPPELGEEVARLIPGARFEVYEHSGHMLASEERDRLLAEVEAFAAS